jgi:hypothetical protein
MEALMLATAKLVIEIQSRLRCRQHNHFRGADAPLFSQEVPCRSLTSSPWPLINPLNAIELLQDQFLILSPQLCPGLFGGLLPSGFPTRTLYALLSSSRLLVYLNTRMILLSSTDHETPHYPVSCHFLPLSPK